MNLPAYLWVTSHRAAVCETDNALTMTRIYEALSAIEQRRLTPVEPEEERALTAAEEGLQKLITEGTEDAN
jgi:hypothetical protein